MSVWNAAVEACAHLFDSHEMYAWLCLDHGEEEATKIQEMIRALKQRASEPLVATPEDAYTTYRAMMITAWPDDEGPITPWSELCQKERACWEAVVAVVRCPPDVARTSEPRTYLKTACIQGEPASRVCDRGTKGCVASHRDWEIDTLNAQGASFSQDLPGAKPAPRVSIRHRLREVAKGKLDADTEAEALCNEVTALVEWARDAGPVQVPRANAAVPDERSDQAKWYVKARVYGVIAAEYQRALTKIRDGIGVTASHVTAREALDWRHSENGGVPRKAVDEIGALLGGAHRTNEARVVNDGSAPPPPLANDELRTCWCFMCLSDPEHGLPRHLICCPACGNKRCPRATDHRLACTGSNEPDQFGSRFGGGVVDAQQWNEERNALLEYCARIADRNDKSAWGIAKEIRDQKQRVDNAMPNPTSTEEKT